MGKIRSLPHTRLTPGRVWAPPTGENGTHARPRRVGYPAGTQYPYPNCHPYPELCNEIVPEILIRLPVESLPQALFGREG
jgi:hypothetical protein